MKKILKPLVVLLALAVSTGANAQQDKPIKKLKTDMRAKEVAHPIANQRVPAKEQAVNKQVVQKRNVQVQRVVRPKALSTSEIK